MILITVLVLCLISFVHSDEFPDDLPKCALKDGECLKNVYQHVLQNIGEKGIPQVGIPSVDPIHLKNVSVSVMGLLDITLVKGVATGLGTCVFDEFTLDLDTEMESYAITCSFKVEGKYKLKSNHPLIKNVLGTNSIYGNGNGKVSMDKLHLNANIPVYAQKRPDGEIYMKCDQKSAMYDYKILGETKFYADDLHFGNEEVSRMIIPMLNDNSAFIMSTFGKPFIDKAMEIVFGYNKQFFNAVPARYFISDDLTSYAKP